MTTSAEAFFDVKVATDGKCPQNESEITKMQGNTCSKISSLAQYRYAYHAYETVHNNLFFNQF